MLAERHHGLLWSAGRMSSEYKTHRRSGNLLAGSFVNLDQGWFTKMVVVNSVDAPNRAEVGFNQTL